jgi:uncharacterized lipoprotein YmbA
MQRSAWALIALLFVSVGGCAGHRATLVALPSEPVSTVLPATPTRAGSAVLLRSVVLPRYLDSYPVVIGRSSNTLIVSNDAEWAEPFPDAVERVLRDALSQRLGASRVLITGDGRTPDAYLTVEFLALDPQGGALRLDAKWTLSCTLYDSRARSERISLEVALQSATAPAVATATAAALARLADRLAPQMECPRGAVVQQ